MTKSQDKLDQLMADTVEALVAKVEEAGDWTRPWKLLASGTNHQVKTGAPYKGINAIILMVAQMNHGYTDTRWGTFKTWLDVGSPVSKGSTGTTLLFWKALYECHSGCGRLGDDRLEAEACQRVGHNVTSVPVIQFFTVFNYLQTDQTLAELELFDNTVEAQHERAVSFVDRVGVDVRDGGNRAYFNHTIPDAIFVPALSQFDDEPHYWGTLFHELTHWTGHATRLDRTKGGRFGDNAYAFEELVAELGSAFLAAHLDVTVEPHMESAAYLKSWLGGLKAEPAKLYVAARDAQAAVRWLDQKAGPEAVAA